jgi:hypothetical protein
MTGHDDSRLGLSVATISSGGRATSTVRGGDAEQALAPTGLVQQPRRGLHSSKKVAGWDKMASSSVASWKSAKLRLVSDCGEGQVGEQ